MGPIMLVWSVRHQCIVRWIQKIRYKQKTQYYCEQSLNVLSCVKNSCKSVKFLKKQLTIVYNNKRKTKLTLPIPSWSLLYLLQQWHVWSLDQRFLKWRGSIDHSNPLSTALKVSVTTDLTQHKGSVCIGIKASISDKSIFNLTMDPIDFHHEQQITLFCLSEAKETW